MEPNNDQDLNNQTQTAPTQEGTNLPTPEAVSEPTPTPEPTSAPASESQAQTSIIKETVVADSKPTKTKSWIILVVIFAVLAAVGIGFGIWAIIDGSQKPAPAPTTPTNPDSPSSTPTEPTDTSEETVLEDANIIKDLDQKIAYLHFIGDTSPTFVTKNGREGQLYHQYQLDATYKHHVVEASLRGQYRSASGEELASLKSSYPNYDFDAITRDYGRPTEVIDADIFTNRYIDLFGEEPDYDTISTEACSTQLQYDKNTNLLFEKPIECGSGVSPVETYYYKNKYTILGDNIYVYINVVSVDYSTGDIYCFAAYGWGEPVSEPCGATNPGYVQSTASYEHFKEYGDRTTYRFVFTKADNGTYYFEKIEKN